MARVVRIFPAQPWPSNPAFGGDDIIYKMANVGIDAELRFTHAEEIFSLTPSSACREARNNSPEGTLFTDGTTYLANALQGKQTAFKPNCAPIHTGSYFYRLDELKRCYG